MIVILVLTGLCIAALLLLCRKARLNKIYLALAVAVAGTACALALLGAERGVVLVRYTSAPEDTVTGFFDRILAGDYREACERLDHYTDLGMSTEPEDPAAAELFHALHESYAYRLSSPSEADGLTATQRVEFTALDIDALQSDLREEVLVKLAGLVEARSYDEVYDAQDQYRPEITEEAYRAAVSSLLEHREDYLHTQTLTISLRYDSDGWHILPDAALFRALNGYTAV